jgi:hypothetical protein
MRALALVALVGCGGGDCPPGWKRLLDPPVPALSIWGLGRDVWLVGGPLGTPGLGTLALHWDGTSWTAPPRPGTETLWWVWGPPDGSSVWMVGEAGLVLRHRAGGFETVPNSTHATLFGVWGSAADDVWVVGGTPGAGAGATNDVALHWNGTGFDATKGPPAHGVAFFKVWGASPDDVWIVGESGTAWHLGAAGWEDHSAELATPYEVTTVHGCSSTDVWAVANQTVYHWDGARFAPVPAAQVASSANGVACAPSGVLVVGNGGLKLHWDRAADRWTDDSLAEPYDADFHGAWIGPDGTLWAAGGNYNAPPTVGRYGRVAFDGCPVPR